MIAHCSDRLHYLTRSAPFRHAHLVDQDLSVDFSALTQPNDVVTVIASVPLTDNEIWTAMAPGEILMFRDGARQ